MKESPNCLVCEQQSSYLMKDSILQKYAIEYYVCKSCECIFTEEPYWLDEAYSEAISIVDTGIMLRNMNILNKLMSIMSTYFKPNSRLVDFGAGYGMLVRMLRDRGVDAYWDDKYSKNLLSRGFEFDNSFKPDVVVAFEVMEHLPNPLQTVQNIMSQTDCFIFSTDLLPQLEYKNNKDWWYFVPESGQHVFLSSRKTLETLAGKVGCKYKSINGLHIIYRGELMNRSSFSAKIKHTLSKVFSKLAEISANGLRYKSKVWPDNAFVKQQLKLNKKEQ
jgi:hypothetical protein